MLKFSPLLEIALCQWKRKLDSRLIRETFLPFSKALQEEAQQYVAETDRYFNPRIPSTKFVFLPAILGMMQGAPMAPELAVLDCRR